MGEYVDLAGIKTWYDTAGEGDPLVLLHGGMVTNDLWGAQMPVFAERFKVLAPERRGHGHTPDVDGPLRYADMATDTIVFLEVVQGPAHLVGWSDGGIVGLVVAAARPDLVRKLVAISANARPAATVTVPEFQAMGETPPGFLGKFFAMVGSDEPNISPDGLAGIKAPTLILSGDDDIVTLEHTVELYRAIPGSELAVVPGTSHVLPMEKPELVNRIVIDFLENDPPETMLPIRRAV